MGCFGPGASRTSLTGEKPSRKSPALLDVMSCLMVSPSMRLRSSIGSVSSARYMLAKPVLPPDTGHFERVERAEGKRLVTIGIV